MVLPTKSKLLFSFIFSLFFLFVIPITKVYAGERTTTYIGNYEVTVEDNGTKKETVRVAGTMGKVVKSREKNINTRDLPGKWEYTYITTDAQGSTRQEISESQITNPELVEGPNTYYAYGTPITRHPELVSGSILNAQTQKIEDTYTGQKKDEETGLMYYNARYYNPQTGLFIQADSVNDTSNKYQYVASNPVNNTDPSGNRVDGSGVGSGSSSKKGKGNGVIVNNGANVLENQIQSERDKVDALNYLNTDIYTFLSDIPVIWGKFSYETQTIELLDSKKSDSGGGAFTHVGDDSAITKYFGGIAINYNSPEGSAETLVHEFSHVWFEECIQNNACGIDTERFKDNLAYFTFSIATGYPDSSKKQFGITTDTSIYGASVNYLLGNETGFQGFFCAGGDSGCINDYTELQGVRDLDAMNSYYLEHKDNVNYHELFASFSSTIFGQKESIATMTNIDKVTAGIFFPQLNFNK